MTDINMSEKKRERKYDYEFFFTADSCQTSLLLVYIHAIL